MASSKPPIGKDITPVATATLVFTSDKSEDIDSEHEFDEKDPLKNDDKTNITMQDTLNTERTTLPGPKTACDLVLPSPGLTI